MFHIFCKSAMIVEQNELKTSVFQFSLLLAEVQGSIVEVQENLAMI